MTDIASESKNMAVAGANATNAHNVAIAAGASRIMVSRAFNPKASIREDKRKHILRIAGELGYHPDMAARSMATGRSNLVAILVPSIARSWESQEIDCLVEALQLQGMVPLLFRLPQENLGAADIVHVRAYKPVAVIAFIDWVAPSKLVSMFGNSSAIYPHFGDSMPEPITDQTIDRLHINQHAGIQSAVKLLVGAGRRRLVYVAGEHFGADTGAMGANSDRDRYIALEAALKHHKLDLVARLDGNFDYDTARQSVGNFVRHGGKADAFFAANDTSAFGVMDALRFDLGMKIPDQCAVVGFDNIREAGWRAYDLTTVGVPVRERVSALMRLLKARLANPTGPSRIESVTASLVVRSSV